MIRENCLNPYLFDAFGNVKGKRVLDYGCGDGWLCNELKQKGTVISGCDISDKFIDLAKKKYSGINFKVIKDKTNYDNETFDLVICNIVLHITKDYEKVLTEINRILKPKGNCVVAIMHPLYYKSDIADFSKNEEVLDIKVEGNIPVVYYRRSPDVYEKAFVSSGFSILKKQGCVSKTVLSEDLRKYSEKPFFLLYKLKKI